VRGSSHLVTPAIQCSIRKLYSIPIVRDRKARHTSPYDDLSLKRAAPVLHRCGKPMRIAVEALDVIQLV